MPSALLTTRVMFVSGSLSDGGSERFVSTAIRNLDRERFVPSLVLFRHEIAYGLPVDVSPVVLNKRSRLHGPSAVARLACAIRTMRPDVVLSAHTGVGIFLAPALSLLPARRPVWISRMAADPHRERGTYGALVSWCTRRADIVLANSNGMASGVTRRYGRRDVRVLLNAADVQAIDTAGRAVPEAFSVRGPKVVMLGRLVAQKRYDLVLRAVASIADRVDFTVIILGDGPLRGQLERLARSLGVAHRVRFYGFVDNPYCILANANVFVLASDFEGLPNALIEAQVLGIPAVSTDCPYGPREVIEDGVTGRLVPVGDVDALARGLEEVLGNPELAARWGAAARKRARERFSVEVIMPQLERVLEDAASRWRR